MMTAIRILTASLAAVALLGSAALAHGPSKDENLAGRPGDPKNVVRTVRLVASEIKFDIDGLSFKSGDTIKFIIVNKGEQDHELAIGDRVFQLNHRKAMEAMVTMNPAGMNGMPGHNQMHGNAVTVKPGETRELVWQFTRPGKFEFDCNFPGHAEAGMAGSITVS